MYITNYNIFDASLNVVHSKSVTYYKRLHFSFMLYWKISCFNRKAAHKGFRKELLNNAKNKLIWFNSTFPQPDVTALPRCCLHAPSCEVNEAYVSVPSLTKVVFLHCVQWRSSVLHAKAQFYSRETHTSSFPCISREWLYDSAEQFLAE